MFARNSFLAGISSRTVTNLLVMFQTIFKVPMGTTGGVATSQGTKTTHVSWVLSPGGSSWLAGRGREPSVYLLGG